LTLIRPADATETAEAWAVALQRTGPTLFALTRQNLPHLDRSGVKDGGGVKKGAYILSEADGGKPDVILIGTGSEVALCTKAQEKLRGYGIKARVVSMPSWNLFDEQDESYRNSVLPKAITKRVTVEAASTFGWNRWAGDGGTTIGIDHYGASAPGEEILRNFGFTVQHVTAAALRLMGKSDEANREYEGETVMMPTSPSSGHS